MSVLVIRFNDLNRALFCPWFVLSIVLRFIFEELPVILFTLFRTNHSGTFFVFYNPALQESGVLDYCIEIIIFFGHVFSDLQVNDLYSRCEIHLYYEANFKKRQSKNFFFFYF